MLDRILKTMQRRLFGFGDALGPQSLRAQLIYLKSSQKRPGNSAKGPSPDAYEARPAKIRNLRRLRIAPQLDVQGFTLVRESTAVKDFYDEMQVRALYYPEVEMLLEKATGASRVLVIDHITRRRPVSAEQGGMGKSRKPVGYVHVDYTPNSAALAVQSAVDQGMSELPTGRVQIINVWRPIRGPLVDTPLAVCDARTVDPDDLVPMDLVYPDKVWETYSVTGNSQHQWFYVPSMNVEEALLFKSFDSEDDGRARFTPHAAFADPTMPADAIPRESIEVRALVFD